jgi:hypothetical protein
MSTVFGVQVTVMDKDVTIRFPRILSSPDLMDLAEALESYVICWWNCRQPMPLSQRRLEVVKPEF